MVKIQNALYELDTLQRNAEDVENAVRDMAGEDISTLNESLQGKINKVIAEWDYMVKHNFEG